MSAAALLSQRAKRQSQPRGKKKIRLLRRRCRRRILLTLFSQVITPPKRRSSPKGVHRDTVATDQKRIEFVYNCAPATRHSSVSTSPVVQAGDDNNNANQNTRDTEHRRTPKVKEKKNKEKKKNRLKCPSSVTDTVPSRRPSRQDAKRREASFVLRPFWSPPDALFPPLPLPLRENFHALPELIPHLRGLGTISRT